MKICQTLQEVTKFINKRHRFIDSQSGGITAWKMLRKPDGSRIPFEETRNCRIFDWSVDEKSKLITIDTIMLGMSFRKNKKISQSSRLYLYDLSIINIYDHVAEFFSKSSIDFWYMENNNSLANVSSIEQMALNGWIRDAHDVVRARWVSPDEEFDRLAEELCVGRKVVEVIEPARKFDMDFDDF